MYSILVQQRTPEHGYLTIAKTQFLFSSQQILLFLGQFLRIITKRSNGIQSCNFCIYIQVNLRTSAKFWRQPGTND